MGQVRDIEGKGQTYTDKHCPSLALCKRILLEPDPPPLDGRHLAPQADTRFGPMREARTRCVATKELPPDDSTVWCALGRVVQ